MQFHRLTPLERNEVTGALGGGDTVEAVLGLCVVTLSILGLAGVVSRTMLGVATAVAGAALFTEGVAWAAAFVKLDRDAPQPDQIVSGGGFSMQAVGGAAGIVLGI